MFAGGTTDASRLVRELRHGSDNDYQISRYLAVKFVPGAHALHLAVEAAANAVRESHTRPENVAPDRFRGGIVRSSSALWSENELQPNLNDAGANAGIGNFVVGVDVGQSVIGGAGSARIAELRMIEEIEKFEA